VVSAVLVTVAVKVTEFPSSTELLVVETVTATDGGGGGGLAELLTPPQPKAQICAASSARRQTPLDSTLDFRLGERGRMTWPRQAKGQRRRREA
jgi:hypothetical protein